MGEWWGETVLVNGPLPQQWSSYTPAQWEACRRAGAAFRERLTHRLSLVVGDSDGHGIELEAAGCEHVGGEGRRR